ncbi:hypothetical protein ACG7TL_002750 [Trametes sanguinea]
MSFMSYRAAESGSLKDIYAGLPLINNQRLKFDSATPFVPDYVKGNVTRASDPTQAYASRVEGRQLLLDNPPRESKAKKEREEKRAKRASERARRDVGVVSKQEARRAGFWRLREEETKFSLFVPLHSLWLGYMTELLSLSLPPTRAESNPATALPGSAGMHAKLIKADFHGAVITEVRTHVL